MKKTIILSLIASTSMCSAVITNLDFTGNGESVPANIIGIDLIGDGTATVDLTVSGAGLDLNPTGFGSTAITTNGQIQGGETLTFTFSNLVVANGGTATINLIGLLSSQTGGGFVFGNIAGDDATFGFASGNFIVTAAGATNIPAPFTLANAASPAEVNTLNDGEEPLITIGEGFTFSPNGNDSFRIQGFQLETTVTPVPEPTSTALLGLGGLALLARRRRV